MNGQSGVTGGWITSRSPLIIPCHTNNELSKINRKLFHYVCSNVYRLAHGGGPSPVVAALHPRPRKRLLQPTYPLSYVWLKDAHNEDFKLENLCLDENLRFHKKSFAGE